jgi:hypothetical protein
VHVLAWALMKPQKRCKSRQAPKLGAALAAYLQRALDPEIRDALPDTFTSLHAIPVRSPNAHSQNLCQAKPAEQKYRGRYEADSPYTESEPKQQRCGRASAPSLPSGLPITNVRSVCHERTLTLHGKTETECFVVA